MPTLYVKTDQDGNVIEACPIQIEGGTAVNATQVQIDEIMKERKDAIVVDGAISSTSLGDDYTKRQEISAYRDSLIAEQSTT